MTASYDARGFAVPLDQPYPGAPLGEVWRRFWRKGFTFTGRASRAEYWKFTLLQIGITFGLYSIILAGLIATDGSDAGAGIAIVLGLLILGWLLATVVPGIALAVRRLHDANYPGSYYLFSFIPLVGAFILLILLAQASHPAGARFDDRQVQPPYGHPGPAGGWPAQPASSEPFGYRPDTVYGQPAPYVQPPAQYGYAEPTFAPAPDARSTEPWGYAGPSQPAETDDGDTR